MMSIGIVLGKVEECVMLQQRVLEMVTLDGINLYVGCDSAAAVNSASAISQLYFLVGGVIVLVALEIVVVKRNVAIVTLNQTSAWCVVLGGGQCKTSVIRQRIYRLHQSLAECGFTDNQSTIMVLNRAGNNLSSGCQRLVCALPKDRNVNGGALWAF